MLNSIINRSFGGTIVAGLAIVMMTGCGGSGGNSGTPPTTTPSTVLAGGVSTYYARSQTPITGGAAPQPATVTNPTTGQTELVWIPAETSVTTTQPLAIIPANTPIIANLTNDNSSSTADIHPAQTGNNGSITINGYPFPNSHFHNGVLDVNIGFPAGKYNVTISGPFYVGHVDSKGNPIKGQYITVGQFQLNFESDGVQVSLPTTFTGYIPVNGAPTVGDVLQVNFGSDFPTGIASTTVIDANGSVTQKDAVASSVTTIHNYTQTDGVLNNIPTSGIDSFNLTYQP